ncbi:hypothetical protein ACGFIF_01875 [Kribbella sp. NPDC049174]|uniref:hypothetical protein n=1 Tax=Kribbella sp. NPDC049174 TaxID=3364112 RepID=UPI0037155AFE
MDVAVLLLLATFITAVAVATISRHEVLRTSVRRPLLLNVAASCGVAALHGCLRGRALAGSAPAATTAGAAAACSPETGTGSRPGALLGSGPGSGGQVDDGRGLRMGVLGWTGPLIALVVVTAVVALGSGSAGNGTVPGSVGTTAGSAGSALAIYSLLVCVISASSLFRGRPARSAIDPREG